MDRQLKLNIEGPTVARRQSVGERSVERNDYGRTRSRYPIDAPRATPFGDRPSRSAAILSWLGLSEQAIGAIAGAGALAAYWVYGLRILIGVDVVAPFVRRLTPESTDAPERRDAAELASALESRFERIVETETKLAALGRPTPETLSMTADERRRRATRLLAALEDDWGEVSRLASALEGKQRGGESGAETDGWVHLPVRIRGHDATTWVSEARTRRERIGYWLESDPVEGGMLDTALLLDVGSTLLADELEPRPDAEAQSSSR